MSYQSDVKQQPGATPGMQVGQGGNRNVKQIPTDSNGERDWSNGFFGCFGDIGTCCKATFCSCLVYSENKSRYEHLNSTGRPHPSGGEMCGVDCCLFAVLHHFGFGWAIEMGSRGNIRKRYNIGGGGMGDCCSAACCMPCELTQASQELELEEQSFRG